MADDSKKISRRDLLMGGVRRLRKNAESIAQLRADDSPLKRAGKPPVSMFDLGERALAEGELDKAAQRLRECVKADPNDLLARLKLGEALYRLDKFIQARVELDRILRTDSENHLARLYLGLTMCKMGKPDKVKAAWEGYFEPENLELQREINIQLAFLETEEDLDLDEVAACVERVAGLRPEREGA
ncbi:MAG: hypothetical protein PWQ57_291 [Desulfovibrionales bacterium]|nr:hypothetical protein [Desulfovibrionales bacterium]